MKDGNWIPIDKNLAKFFPDRKFSEIEAAFSLTLDCDNNKSASIAGYSKLWGWSRSKVRLFLDNMGVEISYPEDLSKKQNQKGQIKVQMRDRSATDQLQIRMVNTKGSHFIKDRSKTDDGQISDRSPDTTSKPIKPKPKPKKETFSPLKNKQEFIDQLPESITRKYEMSLVLSTLENLIDYCKAHGKKYIDYNAALRSFLKKDLNNSNKQAGNEKPKQIFKSKIISKEERQNQLGINRKNSGRMSG